MLGAIPVDLITGLLSFLFTVLILSYLVGDNPLFRLAVHAFVGISSGYIALVVFRLVIVNKMFLPLAAGTTFERTLLAVPLVLSLLLLGKSSSRFEWMGRPVVAMLVGVGAASALAGAVLGTIFPQVISVVNMFGLEGAESAGNLFTGLFVLAGTILTLAYFQFTVFTRKNEPGQRDWPARIITLLGQVFIAITLGAIFAGVLAAALTAFVDRAQSLVSFFNLVISKFIP